jgi:hypothetical protein
MAADAGTDVWMGPSQSLNDIMLTQEHFQVVPELTSGRHEGHTPPNWSVMGEDFAPLPPGWRLVP